MKINKNNIFQSFITLFSISVAADAAAVAPLFADVSPIDIVLELPLREINRADRGEDMEGAVILADGTRLEAKFAPRGRSRLDQCRSIPPIWVDLDKDEVGGTIFAGQNRMKLVTHCQRSDRYDDLVVSEYLNYRILNLMTDASYRARLARVTYRDIERDDEVGPRYAFFVEYKDALADRTGLVESEFTRIHPRRLDPQAAVTFEIFAFMVSHTDWSALQGPEKDECCHNTHLFEHPDVEGDFGRVVPVGYDFDLTGTVDPPYGEPPLDLRNWQDRKYRGWCWGGSTLPDQVDRTRSLRDDIRSLVMSESHLSEKRREEIWAFLDEYFEIIDNPQRLDRDILSDCRKLPD